MTEEQSYNRTGAVAATALQVLEMDSRTDPRWEVFVNRQAESLIYHHPAWLQVLEEAYDCKPMNLACEDASGHLRGILPLYYERGLLIGRRFASLPRTPVAGPLACDEQAATLLVRAAVERVRSEPGAQFQLKMMSNALDGLVDEVVQGPTRAVYVLELPERADLLRIGNSRNHTRIKWAVNKARKSGVQISQAENEQELRAWYELYLHTMRWLSAMPRPYRFFEVAWRRLQPLGLLRLLLARHYEAGRCRLLAGSLFLMHRQTVFYAFSGWRREEQALRPNDALHWQAIQDACAEGFRRYDFGEVPRHNQGLAEFKSKWGAQPHWLYRYYYPAPREVEIGMLESDSRLHTLASAAWQHLPLPATVLLSRLAHHYL